jgi:hypothetical protein
MAAHFKLNDEEERFLNAPQGAALLFAGASGTETWIERLEPTAVRIGIQAAAVATGDGGSLGVCIEIGGAIAKGEDGPAPLEYRLRATQAVEVLVSAGERLSFKAYPTTDNAQILRAVVWATDLGPAAANGHAEPHRHANAEPHPQAA